MTMWDKIAKWGAAIIGAIAGVFGGWHPLLTILAVVLAIDYVSGILVALSGNSPKTTNGGLSSAAGFKGLIKKAAIILIVLLAALLDKVLGTNSMVFQMTATCYYIANEGLSILENAALLGVPFPDQLKNALEAVKSKSGESSGDKTE